MSYRLHGSHGASIDFVETLTLPASLPSPNPQDPTVQALIRACHLAFGVSYYKASCPKTLRGITLHPEEHAFWTTLYSEGLGEFYYRNHLPIPEDVGFLLDTSCAPDKRTDCAPRCPQKTLILMGGGKDSAVVAELVRRLDRPAEALALGDSPWIQRSTEAAGLTLHTIGRRLDPALFELNRQGALNGHIPISACIAVIATLVAYSGGFQDVLVGNERGADDANTHHLGRAINHQWSKSSRFEQLFQHWCQRFVPQAPRYMSLLRPLSEIRIAGIFAKIERQWSAFTSCNRNFRQSSSSRPERWCGQCAKCVFVSLLLAPHLTPSAQASIFGARAFWLERENRTLLMELLGLHAVKPWDCVGTPEECWLSLLAYRVHTPLPEDIEALVVQAPAHLLTHFHEHWQAAWQLADAKTLTPDWTQALHALLDAD